MILIKQIKMNILQLLTGKFRAESIYIVSKAVLIAVTLSI